MFGNFMVGGRLARMLRDPGFGIRKTQKTYGRWFGYFMQGYQLEILSSFKYTSMKAFRP